MSRHSRETLPPAAYLSKAYYDIWISALEKNVVLHGMASEEELRAGKALSPPRAVPGKLLGAHVAAAMAKGTPCDRPAPGPARFAVGDRARTKVMNPTTHTRLPRYARGKVGVIEAVRGCHVFPDANAHGLGEDPRWLYTISFSGRELWGEDGDPASRVSIDAFEPYLDPA
jgi:nitrile hydratase beta subunit